MAEVTAKTDSIALSEMPASAAHRRAAFGVLVASVALFAALVPFAKVKLAEYPAFIAAYESALVIIDLVTASLIFSQYRVSRASALAVLGAAYLFAAAMAGLHALTFPGLLAPHGLLGAGEQTTAWMYILWHGGFAIFIALYAALKGRDFRLSTGPAVGIAIAAAAACTLATTSGHDVLPRIMNGNTYTGITIFALGGTWVLSGLAALTLWVRRPHTVLDLWLIVAMIAWIGEIGLAAVFNSGRFDLGFYVGRIYGLVALSALLLVLLYEYGFLCVTRAARDAENRGEARFRTMVDAIPQLAWIARPDGWIYWYNRRWYEYTGTRPEEMQGWGWQSVHDPQMLPSVMEQWKRSILTGEPFEMIFPLRGADGLFRAFLTRVSPLKDEDGRVLHWFGTNTDITRQREAEEALRAADRRKDEFLATLAHELRNPLAPIRSAVDLMRLEPGLGFKMAHVRDVIDRQSRHLARLVDDLLEISRITRGKLHLHREPIALRSVIDDALEAANPLMRGLEHSLAVQMPDQMLYVDGDATRLAQVFTNLLNNAAKFTPKGGRISLIVERSGSDDVSIRIRDSGIGIPADRLAGLFEMFSQVEPPFSRQHGGVGIGLALARGLVEMHGGRIEAHSAGSGQGSEFVVRLPLCEPPMQSRAAA